MTKAPKKSPLLTTMLWVLAIAVMMAAATYQRTTGPTYELKGSYELNGDTYTYELVRSALTTAPALVELPLGSGTQATLNYRRYPGAGAWSSTPFQPAAETETAAATGTAQLPIQPAAGKMAYYITVTGDGASVTIPDEGPEQPILLRYKDPVPTAILLPHVLVMFLAMLFGVRAGLGALAAPSSMRRWSVVALAGITLGGMILGPIVQEYAFGAYWTGFPFGTDLTDNKTLIMWVVWIGAVLALRYKPGRMARMSVVLATLVMLMVYVIPHSLRGSELDYDQMEQGVDPADAIGTADQ